VSSVRLQTFAFKGIICTFCEKEGSFFAVEKHHERDVSFHINLYGHNAEGRELLFTRDHIIPHALGGPDHLDNMQTACERCNRIKGTRIIAPGENLVPLKKKKKEKKLPTMGYLFSKRWDSVPWQKFFGDA